MSNTDVLEKQFLELQKQWDDDRAELLEILAAQGAQLNELLQQSKESQGRD
jgi:hypothetical protein